MKPVRCDDLRDGLPVNALTGALVLAGQEDVDFVLRGIIALTWQRTYCSTNAHAGWLGRGWASPLEAVLERVPDRSGDFIEFLDFIGVTGRRVRFDAPPPGGHTEAPGEQMRLSRDEAGQYRLSTSDGLSYLFDADSGERQGLAGIVDRNGNTIVLRHGQKEDAPIEVVCPGGRRIALHLRGQRLVQVDGWWPGATEPTPLVRYGYDQDGRLSQVLNRAGECVRRFRYGPHGMLVWQSHAEVFESWIDYDDGGGEGGGARAIAYRDNVGRAWRLDYQEDHTAVTDVQAQRSLYHLDAQRRWTGYTDPLGQFSARGLDKQGRVRMVRDAAGHVEETVYDEGGNPVEVRDPMGAATGIAWHAALNLPLAITDPLGHTTRFEYDERGNLLVETSPGGVATGYEYDERGLVTAVTDGKGGRTELVCDEHGQLVLHTDCSGRRTRLGYDAEGKLILVDNALGEQTVYHYDAAGRLARQALPDGSFEQYEWNAANQLTATIDHLGRRTTYDYAPDGQLTKRTNAARHALTYEYDPARRLSALVNENGAAQRFAYDALDQLIEEIRFDGTRACFAYDASGFLVRSVEAPGSRDVIETAYQRDATGRLLARQTADTLMRFQYDAVGNVVAARSDPDETIVRLSYDKQRRVVEETVAVGGTVSRIAYAYDELGNRIQTTLPGGQVIGRLNYGGGHVHQLNVDGQLLSDIERDALHREVSRTQGGLLTTRAYDPVGRLTALNTRANGVGRQPDALDVPAILADRRFVHDRAGRLIQAVSPARTRIWEYDELDRLTRYDDERFAFDPAHNLLDPRTAGKPGAEADTGPRIGDNRVAVFQDWRYAYDDHGRIVEKRSGAHTLMRCQWDGEHRLRQAEITGPGGVRLARYAYDAFGRRVAKWVDGVITRFIWEGDQLLQVLDGQRELTFVYEPSGYTPMAQLLRDAQADAKTPFVVHHYHCDPWGLPAALSDEDGRLVWQGEYSAWGRLQRATKEGEAAVRQPLRLQGQYCDEETGWHYNRFRYYDPDVGRFTVPDPLGLKGGINPYLYAPNPVGWIDPLGLTRSPVQCAADKALEKGKESGAACQLEIGASTVLTDVSGNPGKLHPKLRRLLKVVEQLLIKAGIEVPAWHGSCAEVGCLNQAFKQGLDPTGGKSTAVNIGSKLKGQKHAHPKKACPSCQVLLKQLDITDGNE